MEACGRIFAASSKFVFAALIGAAVLLSPAAKAQPVSAFQTNILSLGPVGYWRLNETSNPNPGPVTAADSGTNALDGVYGTNALNFADGVTGPDAPAFPGFETDNGAIETSSSSSNNLVTVPALNLTNSCLTVLMWIFPTADQAPGTGLFFCRGTDSVCGFSYGAHSPNMLGFNANNNSLSFNWDSFISPPQNIWSLVALTVTSSNVSVYCVNTNGISTASTNLSNSVMAFLDPSAIGGDTVLTARTFNGSIDEVAVFSSVLTEGQLGSLYTSGSGVVLSPTVTSQPAAQFIYAGGTAQYAVSVVGSAPFFYQWYATNGSGDFVPIDGATNTTLFVTNVSAASSLQYEVVITNAVGPATSSVAPLTIVSPSTSTFEAAVIATTPVAYWRFNETNLPAGGTNIAYDYSGGFDGNYGSGTLNGANGIIGPLFPAFRGFEAVNHAVETFNGQSNSYVTVPPLNLNTNTVSISMWINPNGIQSENTALFFWRGTNSAGLIYNAAVADGALAYNWGDGSGPYLWDSGLIPPTNIWSFVTLVVTSSNATMYMDNVNGQASASINIANANMTFSSPSAIGTDPFSSDRTFNGLIDEVAIYNQALTSNQVANLFAAASTQAIGVPVVTTDVLPELLFAGRTAQYSVGVSGLSPFFYQWMTTNGSGAFVVPLTDGPGISGSTTAALAISNVSLATPALYEVVITNAAGSVTSSVATLNIVIPVSPTTYEVAISNDLPVARWKLNEKNVNPASGNAPAFDFFGGFTGTYGANTLNGGSPTPIVGPTPPIFPGFATNEGAVETFTGEDNSYVTVPPLNLNTNTITCTMWVHPNSIAAQNTGLMVCRGGTTVAGFGFCNPVPGMLGYNWNNELETYNWASGVTPPVDTWSFVAWVITPTNATIYQLNTNGLTVGSIDNTHILEAFDAFSTIGSDSFTNSRTFDGMIADVAMFNQALSESQVIALFTDASGGLTFPPTITQQPLSPTLYAGRNLNLITTVSGNAPFFYQWLTNNGSGAFVPVDAGMSSSNSSSTLVVSNVSSATPAQYELVISNVYGAVTSSVATLTVVTPGAISSFESSVASNQPIAFWRLDETNADPATGTALAFDYYGGLTGSYGSNTLNGGSTPPISGPPSSAFPGFAPDLGAVETFSGVTNADVTVPALDLTGGRLSCSMWINPSASEAPDTALFFCRGGTTVAGFSYCNLAANVLGYTWNNDFNTYDWNSGISPPIGIWSFVTWVVTPTDVTLYMMNTNGTSSANFTYPNPFQVFDAPCTIGSDPFSATRTFAGEIADVALFSQPLTSDQVQGLYAAGFTQSSQPIQTNQPVSLQILMTPDGGVTVSWPTAAGTYTLQANSDLTTTNWAIVTNTPTVISGSNTVTLPATATAQFFRLGSQ